MLPGPPVNNTDPRSKMIHNAPKQSTFNQETLGILVGLVVLLLVLVAIFIYLYRRKVGSKSKKGNKPTEIHLPEVEIFQPPSTFVSEPNTPTHLELSARTFHFPSNSRTRINSSSSANSSAPLIRRNGSYRSRLSSGVSSRLDSNITEGKSTHICQRFTFVTKELILVKLLELI